MCGGKHILALLVHLRTKCSQFSRFLSRSLVVNLFIHNQLCFQIHNGITSSAQTAFAVILRDVFSHCFNTSQWWERSSWSLSVIWVSYTRCCSCTSFNSFSETPRTRESSIRPVTQNWHQHPCTAPLPCGPLPPLPTVLKLSLVGFILSH